MLANWSVRDKIIAGIVMIIAAVFVVLALMGGSDDGAKQQAKAVSESSLRDIIGEWKAKGVSDPIKFTIYVNGQVSTTPYKCDGIAQKVEGREKQYKISECVTYVNPVEGDEGRYAFSDAQLSSDGKTLTITAYNSVGEPDSIGEYVRDK